MAKRKNLLFVFADQWRRSALGAAQDEPVVTPHMDAFAREAVYCENGVSSLPLCSPARASILAGRTPLSTGVFTNCKTGLAIRLKDEERCISDVLRDAGYRTGYIGKWHLDEPELNHGPAPASGARNWDAYTPPGPRRHGFDFWHSYGAWDQHNSPHYWRDDPEKIQVHQWSPIHETDVALDFICGETPGAQKDADAPFALFLSWNPPHSPYDTAPQHCYDLYPPARDLPLRPNARLQHIEHHTEEQVPGDEEAQLENLRGYYAAISGIDEQFGRLMAELKASGQYENTLIVLTADHGDMMLSHGMMGKHVWYEESIGVPLIFGGGGLAPGRSATVIGSEDLAPTMLSLLSLPIPDTMDGCDCSDDIRLGESNRDKAGFLAACPGRDVFLEAFEEAGENPWAYGWRAIRTGRHCYAVDLGYYPGHRPQRLLYDLQADPYQLSPEHIAAAAGHPVAQALEERLFAHLAAKEDPFLHALEKAQEG